MPETKPEAKLIDRKSFDIDAEIDKVRAGVVAAPTPGTDPDSKQRLAKTLDAAGVEVPAGLSVDPVTDKDREKHVTQANKDRDRLIAEAGAQRKLAAEDAGSDDPRAEAPQGRTSQQGRQQTAASTKPTAKS